MSVSADKINIRLKQASLGKCKEQAIGDDGVDITSMCERPVMRVESLSEFPRDPRGHFCDLHWTCLAPLKNNERCSNERPLAMHIDGSVPTKLETILAYKFSPWCDQHFPSCRGLLATRKGLKCETLDCKTARLSGQCRKIQRNIGECELITTRMQNNCYHESIQNIAHSRYLEKIGNRRNSYVTKLNKCEDFCKTLPETDVDEEGFSPVRRKATRGGASSKKHKSSKKTKSKTNLKSKNSKKSSKTKSKNKPKAKTKGKRNR